MANAEALTPIDLAALVQCSRELAEQIDLGILLNSILAKASELTDSPDTSVILSNNNCTGLYFAAATGSSAQMLLEQWGEFSNQQIPLKRPRAQKRGGDRRIFSLDFPAAEMRYGLEPAHELTPEKLYERQWALTLLDQVLNRLQDESVRAGHGRLFDALKLFLTGETPSLSHEQRAASLGLSVGAVKVAVHRLRRRYRELLRAEIGRVVGDPSEVDEEIRALFAVLG
jgi:hypothetical protein